MNGVVVDHRIKDRKFPNVCLPSLLHWRSTYYDNTSLRCGGQAIQNNPCSTSSSTQTRLYTHLSRSCINFTNYPQIISPHSFSISSMDVDNTNEGRFLLAGSRDCTVSVYDLHFGSEEHLNVPLCQNDDDNDNEEDGGDSSGIFSRESQWKQKHRYPSIARSRRVPPSTAVLQQQRDPNYLAHGHSHAVTQVQWYPIDTGAFLSSDATGNILLWDTNSFTPVTSLHRSMVKDFQGSLSSSSCAISCMDIPKMTNSSHLLLAIGSQNLSRINTRRNMLSHIGAATRNDPSGNHGLEEAMILDDRPINLCDIRSGAMTHELIGHGAGGVLSLQWSPTQEFSLVSGGLDGTIKFWDVRKSGSGSCLFTLDCENKRLEEENEFIPRSKMDEDKEAGAFSRVGTKRRRHKESSMISRNVVGPSNYSKVQNHSVQSHNGPVTSLSFTPDGRFLVSASAADGIHLWYLQDGCCRSSQASTLAPTAFLGPSSTQPFPFRKKQRKTPLLVTQPGAWKSATVWAAGVGQSLLGYELHGRGGRPNNILTGHLDDIECMVSQDNSFRIMTGDKEGMILCWGRSLDYDDHDEQI